MAQSKGKYWLANNPSAEISNAEAAELDALLPAIPQAAEADLGQTISGTYDDAEVQAISDKVDALLAKLRSAKIISS
tara:strand:+ start:875 stop:1105 length:231 start_codon:yes stop_codon:yes gene_type:complete